MNTVLQLTIGFIIGVFIVAFAILVYLISAWLVKSKVLNKQLLKKWQFWVVILFVFGLIGNIIPKYKNQEIIGSVLYIYRDDKHSFRRLYQRDAAEEFEEVDIPSEVNEVCVWFKTSFTDAYGNESEDTIYRVSLSVEDISRIDWDKFIPENIENLSSSSVYAWSGLE